ncbi:MAG: hypothetical protein IT177_01165 [Acidobacteria bacterium]|nr:hypothetical protein [Acidobacteriota bacterium]
MLACPICATPEGALMSDGARTGALVLIVVTVVVLTPLAAFGVRLWRREREHR